MSLIVTSNKIPLSFWFPFCCFCWGMLTLGVGCKLGACLLTAAQNAGGMFPGLMYGSNATIAWFDIMFFPITDAPDFTKGYAAALATCVLSPPIALWIHKRCQCR